MKNCNLSKVCKSLVVVLFLALFIINCKKKTETTLSKEPVVDMLNNLKEKPIAKYEGIIERTDYCISLWENGTLDSEPFLILSAIVKPIGESPNITLFIYDEDKDIVGIGIKEEHFGKDNSIILIEEEYPVFKYFKLGSTVEVPWFYFKKRENSERKDEKRWQEVLNEDPDKLLKKYESDKDSIPKVYVSIPETNKVDVWIYVYDKAGNKSGPVKLLNLLNNEN